MLLIKRAELARVSPFLFWYNPFMNYEIANFIISEEGRTALNELASENLQPEKELALLTRLRRRFNPEQTAALLEVAGARQRAVKQGKFSRAAQMFFTKSGLEQSSGERIANYRAARMARSLPPGAKVADLGCGIGGDSLAMAQYFRVSGVDLDAARLVFARANAAVYNLTANFEGVEVDLTQLDLKGYDAIFFDPARRSAEGKRYFSVEAYQPPLSIIQKWLPLVPEIAVKISPGVDYSELAKYDCEVEIISDEGEVKEAILWFGRFRSDAAISRRATLLPGLHTLTNLPALEKEKKAVPIGPPLAYLYEPDGAVIRAGLVEELALQLGDLQKLDPDIAYLTGNTLFETPFARAYRVREYMPFNLKKLIRRLQELKVGRVIIKKRGSPLDPQQLERALKLKGDQTLTLFLTHLDGKPFVVLSFEF